MRKSRILKWISYSWTWERKLYSIYTPVPEKKIRGLVQGDGTWEIKFSFIPFIRTY